MSSMNKNPKLVIKSYEQIGSNRIKIAGLDADSIEQVEYELSFCNMKMAIDRIKDALYWKKVVYLGQMIRW